MAVADERALRRAVELLDGKLTERLQQPVAGGAFLTFGLRERLIDKTSKMIQDVLARYPGVGTDRLGGLERPAASKHCQAAEDHLVDGREQVVAPRHGGAEGAVARIAALRRGA